MRAAPFALALLVAGCLSAPEDAVLPAALVEPAVASHVLAGAVEPEGLEAPVFRLLGAVAKGGPAYGAGEPSVWAHTDGTAYLSFPGCEEPAAVFGANPTAACDHGMVYRSDDAGGSWTKLNDERGRLDASAEPANGDADVAVDAAGTVYASDLGGGIQVFRSTDRGATWTHVADVVPDEHWADRQWMAAADAGRLVMAWMGGEDREQRAVAVRTTTDGGDTWTDVTYLGEDIGWIGTVQFDPTGTKAFVPFTEQESEVGPQAPFVAAGVYKVLVARSLDGGLTWDVVDTGARTTTSSQGGHWSGVLMAPALDVTGDGTVVVAWSEERLAAGGLTSDGAVVKLAASKDDGATWTAPYAVSTRAGAIMPWVTGGAGDRVALTWFASDVPLDTDYAGRWDVEAAVVDGVATGAPEVVVATLDTDVHLGGLCARGGGCFLTASDRALLDFFESDLLPDGRLLVVYPADPPQGGKYIEIRTAVQDGGTPLLARAG